MGLNDFNIPRERRDTFQGMFEAFLDGFSQLMEKDISTQNIDEVVAEAEKLVEKKPTTQEIHVHVHTEAATQGKVDPKVNVKSAVKKAHSGIEVKETKKKK